MEKTRRNRTERERERDTRDKGETDKKESDVHNRGQCGPYIGDERDRQKVICQLIHAYPPVVVIRHEYACGGYARG